MPAKYSPAELKQRSQARWAALAEGYEIEIADDLARGGKMPEPVIDLGAVAETKAAAEAEHAKLATEIATEKDAEAKAEKEKASKVEAAKIAEAEYLERIASGKPTAEDLKRQEAEQAAYDADLAAKIEWLSKQ